MSEFFSSYMLFKTSPYKTNVKEIQFLLNRLFCSIQINLRKHCTFFTCFKVVAIDVGNISFLKFFLPIDIFIN